ncbi:unnamed protein product, partial [Pylaiella littoralis]
MCRSAKGEGCSEFKEKKRSRCVHTLIVAIFTGVLGRGSTVARSGTTADADDASGSASSGGPVLPRTPQLLAKRSPDDYRLKVDDMLFYISRHKFPPIRPSELPPVTAEAGRRFKVSQRKCTCGGTLDALEDEDAKVVTGAPNIVTVEVERRKCGSCGRPAWASDDWRKTGVFNYDNKYLVEL